MSVRSPTAGPWSSSQWRPDHEFETDNRTGRVKKMSATRSRELRPGDGACTGARSPSGRQVRRRSPARRGGDRSGVILGHPLRCPPCGRRRAPRSPPSGPIPGERDRFRPLAPPVAVWAAFWGRVADVAAAAGSRAVGRRWAWRCAGLVRQACGLPCVQPRLNRCPPRAYAVVRRTRRRGGAVRVTAAQVGCARPRGACACACCSRSATSWSPASSNSCSLMML